MLQRRLNEVLEQNVLSPNVFPHLLQHTCIIRSACLEWDDPGLRSSRNPSALNKGADVKSKSRNGQTPLSWTARSGHEAVVKLLLEKADIESKPQQWSETTIVGCRERARGGCEAAAREGGRDTSTLKRAEKMLPIASSSEALVLSLTVSSAVPCSGVFSTNP